MSVLEMICGSDGCIQCWAETLIGMTDQEIERSIEQGIREHPGMVFIGFPDREDMAKLKRSGRRETRLFARLALLEVHECGKA